MISTMVTSIEIIPQETDAKLIRADKTTSPGINLMNRAWLHNSKTINEQHKHDIIVRGDEIVQMGIIKEQEGKALFRGDPTGKLGSVCWGGPLKVREKKLRGGQRIRATPPEERDGKGKKKGYTAKHLPPKPPWPPPLSYYRADNHRIITLEHRLESQPLCPSRRLMMRALVEDERKLSPKLSCPQDWGRCLSTKMGRTPAYTIKIWAVSPFNRQRCYLLRPMLRVSCSSHSSVQESCQRNFLSRNGCQCWPKITRVTPPSTSTVSPCRNVNIDMKKTAWASTVHAGIQLAPPSDYEEVVGPLL